MAFALKVVLRVLGLVWVGILVALAWEHTPRPAAVAAPAPKPAASVQAQAPVQPEAPAAGAPRVVYGGSVTGSVPASRPASAPAPAAKENPAQERPVVAVPAARDVPAAPAAQEAPVRVAAQVEPPVAPAPGALNQIDLNTASVPELNELGAGMIGRAIVAGRPYASPDDLVAKRILNRATYARIKDRVTTR